jgi:transcription antitermination protein NusB
VSKEISERRKARDMLLQALYQWSVAGQSASEIDAQFHVENNMERVDVDYFQEVLRKVIKDSESIDAHFADLIGRPIRELDPVTVSILRLSSYEMAERLDIPFKVVINEAINLAKKFGPSESTRFINGVMDRVAARVRPVEFEAMVRR